MIHSSQSDLDEGDELVIEIHAREIGSASSREDGKERWTEITVYEHESGFLVRVVGKSVVKGEIDYTKAEGPYKTAPELVRSMLRHGRDGKYLPYVAEDALRQASDFVPAIGPALDRVLDALDLVR